MPPSIPPLRADNDEFKPPAPSSDEWSPVVLPDLPRTQKRVVIDLLSEPDVYPTNAPVTKRSHVSNESGSAKSGDNAKRTRMAESSDQDMDLAITGPTPVVTSVPAMRTRSSKKGTSSTKTTTTKPKVRARQVSPTLPAPPAPAVAAPPAPAVHAPPAPAVHSPPAPAAPQVPAVAAPPAPAVHAPPEPAVQAPPAPAVAAPPAPAVHAPPEPAVHTPPAPAVHTPPVPAVQAPPAPAAPQVPAVPAPAVQAPLAPAAPRVPAVQALPAPAAPQVPAVQAPPQVGAADPYEHEEFFGDHQPWFQVAPAPPRRLCSFCLADPNTMPHFVVVSGLKPGVYSRWHDAVNAVGQYGSINVVRDIDEANESYLHAIRTVGIITIHPDGTVVQTGGQ